MENISISCTDSTLERSIFHFFQCKYVRSGGRCFFLFLQQTVQGQFELTHRHPLTTDFIQNHGINNMVLNWPNKETGNACGILRHGQLFAESLIISPANYTHIIAVRWVSRATSVSFVFLLKGYKSSKQLFFSLSLPLCKNNHIKPYCDYSTINFLYHMFFFFRYLT